MDLWVLFDWMAAGIVIGSMIYLSFILTVPEWLAAFGKGKAVSLFPERKGGAWPVWSQLALLVIGFGILFVLLAYAWFPIITLTNSTAKILKTLGSLIYISGFGFLLWARQTLGKNWGLSTSAQVKLHADHELVQAGPFAYIRHPMYFGAWVFMFGLLLLYPTWATLILFVSLLASLWMRAQREEAALAERFGKKWADYKQRTKFIIPFLA
jgi:protein-S-isoprenylcysteine O-methyltransferase Ste14